jgi:hypothetical protein
MRDAVPRQRARFSNSIVTHPEQGAATTTASPAAWGEGQGTGRGVKTNRSPMPRAPDLGRNHGSAERYGEGQDGPRNRSRRDLS